MALDAQDIITTMMAAAQKVLSKEWPKIQDSVASETKIFAERLVTIERLRLAGTISESRAKSHIEFQKESWETFLLSAEGLSQLMVEEALNAALNAVKDIVNTALKFPLL
jgi:hypothetical protein